MEPREFTRRRARIFLSLPIRVFCRESVDYEWTEKSRLIDVTQFGAGFTIKRPVDVGRLIKLIIPLPSQLRCFDHAEPMYSVWSLVRHTSAIAAAEQQQSTLFRVGVAFVGKQAPASYVEDPTVRYEPVSIRVGQNTRWKLVRLAAANQRRETRLLLPREVIVEALDENGEPSMQENTVTETLSSLGTCIPTNLDVGVGRMVRIRSAIDRVSVFAAIRSREIANDGVARLGLEFVGSRWPLDRE